MSNRTATQHLPSDALDIQFDGVTKRFGEVVALSEANLRVPKGSFFSLLGPSGCGKTTSLRMIAGFEDPSEGDIRIQDRSMLGVPPHKRPVNMVFQDFALFPHLNVFDNVAYGLRQQRPRPDNTEVTRRVGEALEMVRLPQYQRRRTTELSGGQQQRVALARALINRPTVLLLDEPLASLDRKLRRDMQIELQSLQREVGVTFVLVTHDQEEALSMSDAICLMNHGKIVQVGPSRELYDEPVDSYVADFVGKSNFFHGRISTAQTDGATVALADGTSLPGRFSRSTKPLETGSQATIAVRPEMVGIARVGGAPGDAGAAASGTVRNRIYLGEQTEYLVATERFGDLLVLSPKAAEVTTGGFNPGDQVDVWWQPESALVLAGA